VDLIKHKNIFNNIAAIYNWFFPYQVKTINSAMKEHLHRLNLPEGSKILEIGCGTGAYCQVLGDLGYDVTGIDFSEGMLKQAAKRGLNCRWGDVIEGLEFEDNSFDLVMAAYVAHGLDRDKRKKLFKESARISRGIVLFSDYSSQRRPHISFIEYLEDGDYFNFIKNGLQEMKDFFSSVTVISVTPSNNWYLCHK
jgi:ubiquinone/menaquinone biosynthesis C-methylase UbiE